MLPTLKAKEIIHIPLGEANSEDYITWVFSKDGNFTVKSAYQLAHRRRRKEVGSDGGDCSSNNDGRWDKIWDAKALPRVKHLCWRASQDSLPTRSNLYKRGFDVDVYCPMCGKSYETLTHLFLECHIAVDLWMKSHLRLQPKERDKKEFCVWLQSECNKLQDEERGLLMTLVWELWTARNKWIFHGKKGNVILMINHALGAWSSLLPSDGDQSETTSSGVHIASWQAPPIGFMKVNTDASLCDPDYRGLGAIIRNERGEVVAAGGEKRRGNWPADISEACAARWGLKMAMSLQVEKIILELDSLTIVNLLQSDQETRTYKCAFIRDCWRLLNSFKEVRVVAVRKNCNKAAHDLAKFALTLENNKIWMGNYPTCIQTTIEAETLPIN